jgi:hypothetical protein
MKNVLRNILAVVLGLVVGSCVNMGLIILGSKLIAPPLGADTTTMAGLKASIHLFTPLHFLFPFLAHALGTLAGAALAATVAATPPTALAYVIGCAFFAGGLINCFMLPAPPWFMALDLALAYFPMAWLGRKLGAR